MSVRAYKILKIERASDPTFNLWHDEKLMNILRIGHQLNDNGGGEIELCKEDIKKALKTKHDADTTKLLKAILSDCGKEDYVTYDCY